MIQTTYENHLFPHAHAFAAITLHARAKPTTADDDDRITKVTEQHKAAQSRIKELCEKWETLAGQLA